MSSPFKWLTWNPSQFPSGTKQLTKPPEPTKPTHEVSSVSSPLRESQEIEEPRPDLPWPDYNGGKPFLCQQCGTRFDTSLGCAWHQVYGCGAISAKSAVSSRTMPSCPECGSFALYREPDGTVTCRTCEKVVPVH
jgi:hypothetical protein